MTQQKTNPIEVYDKIVKRARIAISAVKPDQMKKPTPCSEWDVTALLEHMAAAQGGLAKIISGTEVSTAGSLSERLDRASAAIIKAIAAPGGMEKKVQGRQGEVPASQMFASAATDLAIHTWDLLKATGQETKLEPEIVDFLVPFAENIAKRGPNKAYFPPNETPHSATKQERLIALTGRMP